MSDKNKSIGVGAAGVAIGAAIGAAAVALSDKKTREKTAKSVAKLSKQATKMAGDLKKTSLAKMSELKKNGKTTAPVKKALPKKSMRNTTVKKLSTSKSSAVK